MKFTYQISLYKDKIIEIFYNHWVNFSNPARKMSILSKNSKIKYFRNWQTNYDYKKVFENNIKTTQS